MQTQECKYLADHNQTSGSAGAMELRLHYLGIFFGFENLPEILWTLRSPTK